MPSGKVHAAITLSIASGVIAPYVIVNLNGDPYLYVAGTLAGVLITPDLDVDAGMYSDTIIRKISPLAQTAWRTLWTPYSSFMPHRGIFSHFPILSTFIRIGYMFAVINMFVLLLWVMGSIFNLNNTVSFAWVWDWSFFFGLCHADTTHFIADQFIKGKEQYEEKSSSGHRRSSR
jgi:uncharacterized metal-binding protein